MLGMTKGETLPVSKDLLDILVCPACKQPVTLTDNEDGLRCATCRVVYPIVDDIPVMLVDKAIKQ
jgi:uncharacterized protein YbaR (Trm112 family)